MAKYKVLVTARSFGTADSKALDLLAANDCEVKKLVAADGPIPEQLKKELPEADAVIAGLEDYDEALIACGSKLKVISRYGVGYDKVDVKAAAVSALAEEEVEKYKDQTVTYGETTVMVGDTSYEIEGYETMLDVYTQDSMAQDYKADLSDWWNGAGELSFVQVLANDDFFGSVFFATDNGELWIYCDGVFFRAEKAA